MSEVLDRKRILLISHSSASPGGAEDDFVSLLKMLHCRKTNYSVDAMFPKGERSDEYASYCDSFSYLKWGFLPVVYMSFWQYLKYLAKFPIQFVQVIKFARKKKYDLCVINVAVLLWPLLTLRLLGYKTIVMIKETIEPAWLRGIIYRYFSIFADFIVPNSGIIEEEYKRITGRLNVRTVYSAVEDRSKNEKDVTEEDLIRELGSEKFELLNDNSTFKFFCIGNIKPIKNQELIINAMLCLKKKRVLNRIEVFFVGDFNVDKEYYRKIMNIIDKDNLRRTICFLGKLERRFMTKIYEYMDCLLITSLSEGVPLVLVYALKFKKLVLSTNTGGIGDVIRAGENGILIGQSTEMLAEEMELLISNPGKYDYLSENGLKTYKEKFNWNINMQQIEDIIQLIAAKDRASIG